MYNIYELKMYRFVNIFNINFGYRFPCRADNAAYPHDGRADKQRYRHDRRTDSQCHFAHLSGVDPGFLGRAFKSIKGVRFLKLTLLFPRHLCQRVYSFLFSVRPSVCMFIRSFGSSFVIPERCWVV